MSVVAAIIQARMGSSRFPGKSLHPVAGKPLFWHLVHRLRQCRNVTDICLATTTGPEDDPLAAYAAELGVHVVRGSAENVLSRYVQATRELAAETIIRITGDAPLIAPDIIDDQIALLRGAGADFITYPPQPKFIDEGFTVASARVLEAIAAKAADDPAAREHVLSYLNIDPSLGRAVDFVFPPGHQFEGGRISIDTRADLELMETLYRESGAPVGELTIPQVVDLLTRRPDLRGINAHVHQKQAYEENRVAVIRCDGGGALGFGHVMRCLNIARELTERQAWGVIFAMKGDEAARDVVRCRGFRVVADVDDVKKMDALLLDLRDGTPPEQVAAWRKRTKVAVLDDASDRRLQADLAFYPPVPQVRRLSFSAGTEVLTGWDWLPVSGTYADCRSGTEILVTMGGSDPLDFTARTVRVLEAIPGDFTVTVVVGRGYAHADRLRLGKRFTIAVAVDDMPARMARATMAVAAFGTTAYELALMGVPSVLLSLSDDHAESAQALAEAGACLSLGRHDLVSDARLAEAILTLLGDATLRGRMAQSGRSHVDGQGAARIAAKIAEVAAHA